MLPLPLVLSEREREVLRLLETPWGDTGAALEREMLSRLAPGGDMDESPARVPGLGGNVRIVG
jgi:hypothetical protein